MSGRHPRLDLSVRRMQFGRRYNRSEKRYRSRRMQMLLCK